MQPKLLATPLLIASALISQTAMAQSANQKVADPSLQFEVASIRPADPIIANGGKQPNIGVYIDGTQFRASTMALRDYLGIGYKLRIYQIEGPDWMASERFDINAKIPDDLLGTKTDGEAIATMMRNLLESRFQIKSHRTSKEFPVYALEQMKDGIRAVESPLEPEGRSFSAGGTGDAKGTTVSLGRGMSLSVGGNKIEAKKYSMEALADTLARFVDRPVVDQTGLKSNYDMTLELTPEDFQALMIRAAVAAGVTLPPQAMALLDKSNGDSLHESLAKVGLKLEAKKVPLDVLVIDAVNRTPTEN